VEDNLEKEVVMEGNKVEKEMVLTHRTLDQENQDNTGDHNEDQWNLDDREEAQWAEK